MTSDGFALEYASERLRSDFRVVAQTSATHCKRGGLQPGEGGDSTWLLSKTVLPYGQCIENGCSCVSTFLMQLVVLCSPDFNHCGLLLGLQSTQTGKPSVA